MHRDEIDWPVHEQQLNKSELLIASNYFICYKIRCNSIDRIRHINELSENPYGYSLWMLVPCNQKMARPTSRFPEKNFRNIKKGDRINLRNEPVRL